MPSVRRLAAILAADVAGYSRLMGMDEEGTHEAFATGAFEPQCRAVEKRDRNGTEQRLAVATSSTASAVLRYAASTSPSQAIAS